jgi:hypothetical protein
MPHSLSVFGMGWPGDKPGFACLLELNGSTIKLQREIESDTLSELIYKCAKFMRDYRETYPVTGLIGRKVDAEVAFLKEHNKQPLNEFLVFQEAPNVEKDGRIFYHINKVMDVLRSDNKRLYLQPECKVLPYLQSIPKVGIQDIKDRDYPAIAALGYGTAYLLQRAGAMKNRNKRGYKRATAWTV